LTIFKDGQPGGANAHARVIGRLKIKTDENSWFVECFAVFCEPRELVFVSIAAYSTGLPIGKFQIRFFIWNYKIGLRAK